MPKLYAIGGVTVDLVGSPYKPLKLHDSNPGTIKYRLEELREILRRMR